MKLIISLLATASLSCFANTTVIYNVNGYTPTYKGETQHFSALVFKDGKIVKFKVLEDVWDLMDNNRKFIDYIQKNLNEFLK